MCYFHYMTIYCTLSTCTCTCTYMKINKGMLHVHVHCICMHHNEELDTTSSTASLVLQNISLSTFQFSHKGLGMLICPVEEDRNRNVACHLYSARLACPPP